ncbi:MAG: adenylate/guanylate cyclase domain-containing protein, partial [Treponema sp.]|nr:adenylate/guanylate cyclase domain-containing protein [Treponema sp.]
GAGHQISLADAAVLSSREYSVITGQVVAVTRRNILLSLTVLFLTILVTWFYSRTITSRLRKLMAGIGSYEAGDFNVDIKTKSRDELGVLTERFAGMGQALNRREEINNLVGRYHDQNISSQAMAGELNLRGEYLKTVVLFVELASFQEISKYLEAPESLELLNSFISKMGECIEKNGGRLDTVISGRLIALWGVPLPSPDISADVLKSLQAAMMMRKTLWDLNTEREKQGKPNLRMGCGIHTGELLAGSMGTSAFRQYSVSGTVIGEAIKTGEAAGSFDTDILITDAVQELAGSRILSEKLTTRRRRKSDLQYFGLVNIAAQNQETQRWPFTLDDVRESLQGSRSVPAGRQGKSADKSDREPAG